MHCGVGGQFGARQLVLHDQLIGQRRAGAAVLLADLRQQEAQFGERAPDRARDEALAAPAVQARREFGRDVAAQLVAEGVDLFVHPRMAMQLRQHPQIPVRPPLHISVWPLT